MNLCVNKAARKNKSTTLGYSYTPEHYPDRDIIIVLSSISEVYVTINYILGLHFLSFKTCSYNLGLGQIKTAYLSQLLFPS